MNLEGLPPNMLDLLIQSRQNEIERIEEEIDEIRDAKVQANRVGSREHLTGPEHTCDVVVRGCDTTRECYCLNSNGRDHSEYEYPLIGPDGRPY